MSPEIRQIVDEFLNERINHRVCATVAQHVQNMNGKPLTEENLTPLKNQGYRTAITYYVDWHGNPQANQEERFWEISCKPTPNSRGYFFVVSHTLGPAHPYFDYQIFLSFHKSDLEEEKQNIVKCQDFLAKIDLGQFHQAVEQFLRNWEELRATLQDFPYREELLSFLLWEYNRSVSRK